MIQYNATPSLSKSVHVEEKTNAETQLYHERQKLEMCGLHALNALLGRQTFTVRSLNRICKEMTPDKLINPHKSILQTGNYDANVLISALQTQRIDVQWFDARKADELGLESDEFLQSCDRGELKGFILNNPHKAMLKLLKRRHWLTIKRVNGRWYNFDSKLDAPTPFPNAKLATQFLKSALKHNQAELFICRAVAAEPEPEKTISQQQRATPLPYKQRDEITEASSLEFESS